MIRFQDIKVGDIIQADFGWQAFRRGGNRNKP